MPENDIRSQLLQDSFAACLGFGFDVQAHHGATLFAPGTELTAMHCRNLDMGNLAIFDLCKQVPSTSVLGVPYLFRDDDHMRAVYEGDVLADLEAEIEQKAGVKSLAYLHIGARHISWVGDREYMTPADLDGVKLRFPGGEGWQFVGTAMGAPPVPVPFTEVCTALQTGTIDGQDNGFQATHSMKFGEILTHMGLTSHLIAANEFTISLEQWNWLGEVQQANVKRGADAFEAAIDQTTLNQEAEFKQVFIDGGIDVHMPDNKTFQDHVLQVCRDSKDSADWPEGLVDAIVAVGQ